MNHFPLRPFQAKSLSTLRQKKHVLMVSETGSGKSRVYYEFSKSKAKRTVLFSPLRALSEQHVGELRKYGLRVPDYGTMSIDRLGRDIDAIVLTPEHLLNENYFRELVRMKPDFLVVDETHCLWDWGKEFRSAFNLILKLFINANPEFSVWGTATMPVEALAQIAEAVKSIGFDIEQVGSFSLPKGLRFQIKQMSLSDRVSEVISGVVGQVNDAKLKSEHRIIFTQTRSMCDRLTKLILRVDPNAARYHSGLSFEEKQNAIKGFKSGNVRVLIATSAFGMGIDLPKVDHVILAQVPFSILQWVQMMGRTARFGSNGNAITYFDADDFRQAALFFKQHSEGERNLMQLRKLLMLPSNDLILQQLNNYLV